MYSNMYIDLQSYGTSIYLIFDLCQRSSILILDISKSMAHPFQDSVNSRAFAFEGKYVF